MVRVSVGEDEKLLAVNEMDGGYGSMYAPIRVKRLNFILFVFYHSFT